MNKIVVFQSVEYYELSAMGWIVLEVVSPTLVVMSQIGTVGKAVPPTTVEIPIVAHHWVIIETYTNPTTLEKLRLYNDTNSPATPPPPLPGGYHWFKYDVRRVGNTIFWVEEFHDEFENCAQAFNQRQVAIAFDTWLATDTTGVIPGPATVVTVEFLVATVAGPVQWRVHYSTGIDNVHPSFMSAVAEYRASGAVP